MSPALEADLVIVGGGIVGLATGLQLLAAHPGLRIAILEKETELATHQSGHNSGVLHAGLYYAPGSLKATLCREGKVEMEAFAERHGIPIERCGKLVVALDECELPRFESLKDRAIANGVPGLEDVGRERIAELEPHAAGIRALWSPFTGDHRLPTGRAGHGRRLCARRGVEIHLGRRVTGIRESSGGGRGRHHVAARIVARHLVVCAGLHADRLAAMAGSTDAPRIVPFRGDYYTLTPDARPARPGADLPGARIRGSRSSASTSRSGSTARSGRVRTRCSPLPARDIGDAISTFATSPGRSRIGGSGGWPRATCEPASPRCGGTGGSRRSSASSSATSPRSVPTSCLWPIGRARPGPRERRLARRRLQPWRFWADPARPERPVAGAPRARWRSAGRWPRRPPSVSDWAESRTIAGTARRPAC